MPNPSEDEVTSFEVELEENWVNKPVISEGERSKRSSAVVLMASAYAYSSKTLDLRSIVGISNLPKEISYMTALERIYIPHSKDITLPPEIDNMTMLKSLVVSDKAVYNLPHSESSKTLFICRPDINSIVTQHPVEQFAGEAVSMIINMSRQTPRYAELADSIYRANLAKPRPSATKIKELGNKLEEWVDQEWPGNSSHKAKAEASQRIMQSFIECSDHLDLSRLNLDISNLGSIITSLTELQSLDLSSNYIGNIAIGQFTREIDNLRKLTSLNLSHNTITNSQEICGLTALQSLDISHNQITSIQGIDNLTALQIMNLSHNRLVNLPQEIGNLTALQRLNLSSNQLMALPQEIGGLTALKRLNISRNQLTVLPSEVGNLTTLQNLFISDNEIGDLPNSLFEVNPEREVDLIILSHGVNQFTREKVVRLNQMSQNTQISLTLEAITPGQFQLREEARRESEARLREGEEQLTENIRLRNQQLVLGTSNQRQSDQLRARLIDIAKSSHSEESILQNGNDIMDLINFIDKDKSLARFRNFIENSEKTHAWIQGGELRNALKQSLYNIMLKIKQKPSLIKMIDNILIESEISCGDRVAITLSYMQIAIMFNGKEPKNMNDQEVYEYSKVQAVIKFLQQKGIEKFEEIEGPSDMIETYLAYMQIAKDLGVNLEGISMLYKHCSNVSNKDLEYAKEEMNAKSSITELANLSNKEYLTYKFMLNDDGVMEVNFVKEIFNNQSARDDEAAEDFTAQREGEMEWAYKARLDAISFDREVKMILDLAQYHQKTLLSSHGLENEKAAGAAEEPGATGGGFGDETSQELYENEQNTDLEDSATLGPQGSVETSGERTSRLSSSNSKGSRGNS